MKLCPKYLNVTAHPVGINSRVNEIRQKLNIGSNDVRFIGIYGMAGIGKTTIVKALYNKIYKEFEGSCFLGNVREAFEEPLGLHYLLEQLIFQLLKIKDFKVPNIDAGISFVKQRLGSKKVLIVLDDLDEIKQLESLAGNWNWFGPGSRIIVTTRDSRLLVEFQVDLRHEVKELGNNESLELFRWHAFRHTTPLKNNLIKLSKDIVSYVGGLPLALEVLGSSLFERTMVEWESVYGKMKEIPHKDIQKKLRISYDALDDDKVRGIFLDIAFFLIGMDKDDVTKILDDCGLYPEIGISILRERCLLTIEWGNKLRMHNLIRDMGHEIVREESVKNPRNRSRLWFHEDAYDVLKNCKGHDENIEGIRLVMPMHEKVDISTRAFHSLPNLRLLQISNVNLTGSFENLFEELRWFCWNYSSLDCLPSSFQAPKLIFLDMQHSKVRTLWEGTKHLQSLKILNASGSRFLKTTPNFKGLESLEKLILQSCLSLSQIHPSIGLLHKLVHLDFNECYSLNQLPEQLGDMECLRKLDASYSSIEQLPDSIGHLGKLEQLRLFGCKKLRNLPSSICDLTSLTCLGLGYCFNLESLPKNFGNLTSLWYIDLSDSNIMQLPDSIGRLGKLDELKLFGCKKLRNLPSSICNLTSLTFLSLGYCFNLESLPKNLGNLTSLTYLSLSETSIMQLPDSIGCLTRLEHLSILGCKRLRNTPRSIYNLSCLQTPSLCDWSDDGDNMLGLSNEYFNSLPSNLSQLVNLKELDVSHCSSIQSLPELPPNLEDLSARGCTSLDKLPNLSRVNNLRLLDFSKCGSLQSLPKLPPNLDYVYLDECWSLQFLPELPLSLQTLHLNNCTSLRSLPKFPPNCLYPTPFLEPHTLNLANFSSLQLIQELPLHLCVIKLSNCTSLKSFSELPTDLVKLDLTNCTGLESLPEFPPVLRELYLSNCTSLKSLPKLPTDLVKLDLTNCTSLESLPELPPVLRELYLNNNTNLKSLPKLPTDLINLELSNCTSVKLDLTNCTSLESLPELPPVLRKLYLNNNTNLKSLPELPTNLINLELSNCSSLESLPELPTDLVELDLTNCTSLESLPELPPVLRELYLNNNTNLKSLPEFPTDLINLESSNCTSLESLPELPTNLVELDLNNCTSLRSLPGVPPVLRELYLNNCSGLESLPELPPDFDKLDLSNCNRLLSLPKLPPNLEDLRLINCTSLRSLPNLPCKLRYLDLTDCSSLESIQELPYHLSSLNASGCNSLQKLPNLSNLTNLRRLILTDCSSLTSNFIWSFLQDCSGFGGCDVYLSNRMTQDCFGHQTMGSSASFQMPKDVKSNFMGMAFWVAFRGKLHSRIKAVITNETDGTEFKYWGSVQAIGVQSWMRYIGKPISMKSGDKIEVSFRGSKDVTLEMCGVHLHCKRVRDVDVEELLCCFKRLKLSA